MKVDPSTYPPPPPPPSRRAPVLVPIEAQVACVEREIRFRKHVYDRRVGTGRMSPQKARAEIEAMEAVLATLQAVAASQRLI